MKKILIADDHAIIRTGLKIIVRELIPQSVVEEAWDGTSVINLVADSDYDLYMLDVSMPETDSMELVKSILDKNRDSKILMISMYNEEIYARKYLQIGAMGYLNKSSPEPEIIKAIENVLDNRKYLSSTLLEDLTHDAFSEKFTNPFARLSKREVQILKLVLSGRGVTDISEELDVGPSTVGTYKARIFKKLNCFSLGEINSLAVLYNFALS